MSISVNPTTHIISVPKSDLTLVSGTLYEHDTEIFRLQLKDWEDSEIGITQPKTHTHNTTITISGVTYARAIEILAPYKVEYENGLYTVLLKGSNNNIADVAGGILSQNTVQVIPGNSAGLQVVTSGSGVTDQDKTDIINGVWANTERTLTSSGSITAQDILDIVDGVWSATSRTLSEGTRDALIDAIAKATMNNVDKNGDIITIYENDGTTIWKQFDLSNDGRVEV